MDGSTEADVRRRPRSGSRLLGKEFLCEGLEHRENVGSGLRCPLRLQRILVPGRRRSEDDEGRHAKVRRWREA